MSDGSGVAGDAGGTSPATPPSIPEAMAADVVKAWADLSNVHKSKTANAGTYSYAYADLGDLLDVARPILAKHSLALIQPLSRDGGAMVTITTMLLHTSGHVLSWVYEVPAAGSPQQIGSAITYGRRYSAAAALGVAYGGDDDDGAAAVRAQQEESFEEATPAPSQVQTRRAMALFDKLGVTERKERLELTSAILGRDVTSWNQVGKDALTVIEELERRDDGLEKARDGVGRLPDV